MPEISKAGMLILWALKQARRPYILGAEAKLTPENFNNVHAFSGQTAWDCSEFCQAGLWAAGISELLGPCGVTPTKDFDGAAWQYERSNPISLAEGISLAGALLFVRSKTEYPSKPQNIGHVAIVIAKGYIIEARGKSYGVTIGPVRSSFNLAAKIKELYTPA